MKTSTKVKFIFIVCLILAILSIILAVLTNGYLTWLAVVIVPLMIFMPLVFTGGFICPKCGGGIYTPPDGEQDTNPYYQIVLLGKCSHCGESI